MEVPPPYSDEFFPTTWNKSSFCSLILVNLHADLQCLYTFFVEEPQDERSHVGNRQILEDNIKTERIT
jgi:hypothetical protein